MNEERKQKIKNIFKENKIDYIFIGIFIILIVFITIGIIRENNQEEQSNEPLFTYNYSFSKENVGTQNTNISTQINYTLISDTEDAYTAYGYTNNLLITNSKEETIHLRITIYVNSVQNGTNKQKVNFLLQGGKTEWYQNEESAVSGLTYEFNDWDLPILDDATYYHNDSAMELVPRATTNIITSDIFIPWNGEAQLFTLVQYITTAGVNDGMGAFYYRQYINTLQNRDVVVDYFTSSKDWLMRQIEVERAKAFEVGYEAGYEAEQAGADRTQLKDVVSTLIDSIANFFRTAFDYEILGVNISYVIMGILGICVAIVVIKIIFTGGK